MTRISTGVPGLDPMLQGGFFPQTANLIEGAPGTGKTTLGMQFIHHGVTVCDEPGIILTFEEFPRQYYHDAAGFGWDLPGLEAENKLRVVMSSPEISLNELQRVGGMLEQHAAAIGAQRILVDSISHFERIVADRAALRETVYGFVNGLKRLGLTILLTRESGSLFGGDPNAAHELAFLVDSYLLLRYVEIDSMMRKALLVLKQRGSDHARDIRQYEITSQGAVVQARFKGQHGLMSGSPTPSPADAFGEAFGRARTTHAE